MYENYRPSAPPIVFIRIVFIKQKQHIAELLTCK